ncbi:MAG: PHP domain-containing protein [Aeromicrobium sp.]|nr:PHP domain-containing protein [Aeromicrobium sp.]
MPGPDLHIHSTASDGTLTPEALVRRAVALGLPAIALTDHDTVAGVSAALEASHDTPLRVIPGVELSAGVQGQGVHILGYFIDHADPKLLSRLEELRTIRITRARAIVASLAETGFEVTVDDVLSVADGGAVGRAHVAQALVAAGHVASVAEAFERLLGSGRPHYVPKPVTSVREVVSWIREAGGVAVVAHPALSAVDPHLPELVSAGVVGLEAYHGSHDRLVREHYVALARTHGLVATGGSDFHGDHAEGNPLGSAEVPDDVVFALEAARDRLHGGEGDVR